MKKFIVTAVIFVFVIFCAITYWGYRTLPNQQTPTVNVQSVSTQTKQATGTWHTVTTVNSDKEWNTPAFSMQGTEWRITYSCTSTSGLFFGSIVSILDTYHAGEIFALDVNCPTDATPSYYYSESPGQYYLTFKPTNSTYNVTVEDYY
jgi:uncharacterized protein YxeA